MSIVCGTDFSESARSAVQAAADLAVRMNVVLHLVHSVQLNTDPLFDEPRKESLRWAKRQLQDAAERARASGARVEIHIEEGPPDETLEDVADRMSAQLIVVAALGHRRAGKWQLGSHAERLAQHAHVPVLVARGGELFRGWSPASRTLRVLVGVDFTQSSESALRWVSTLSSLGPCEIIAAHPYWPPQEFERLGLGGVRSYVDPDPQVTQSLRHEIGKRMQTILGTQPAKLRLEPNLGRLGARLAVIAEEERVDLVVVGSHERDLGERVLRGSVSRDVVHRAAVSVVCVPESAAKAKDQPRFDSVLVATDFSPTGNAAVPLAYSVVADGGTVHLVHVAHDPSLRNSIDPTDIFPSPGQEIAEPEAKARRELSALVPGHLSHPSRTRLHVLRASDASAAICQAAERLDAGLICLGTHGRSGLSKLVLGSVASAVVSGSARPVLLARGPRQ